MTYRIQLLTHQPEEPFPVIMETAPVHTEDHPYCDDMTCPCQEEFKQQLDSSLQDFRQQYELALQEGNRRFGSPCSREHTWNSYCLSCGRKVYGG